jgi:hypothetical protein
MGNKSNKEAEETYEAVKHVKEQSSAFIEFLEGHKEVKQKHVLFDNTMDSFVAAMALSSAIQEVQLPDGSSFCKSGGVIGKFYKGEEATGAAAEGAAAEGAAMSCTIVITSREQQQQPQNADVFVISGSANALAVWRLVQQMGATIYEQSKEHQAVDVHNMTAASRFSDHYRMLLSVAGEYDTPARENTPIDALESQLHPGNVIVPGSENRFKV